MSTWSIEEDNILRDHIYTGKGWAQRIKPLLPRRSASAIATRAMYMRCGRITDVRQPRRSNPLTEGMPEQPDRPRFIETRSEGDPKKQRIPDFLADEFRRWAAQ